LRLKNVRKAEITEVKQGRESLTHSKTTGGIGCEVDGPPPNLMYNFMLPEGYSYASLMNQYEK
jgi:hypothetical protein